jgi:hypothetical protein
VKVVLIANNPEANVPASGFDLYVHFNRAIHWGKTPADKSLVAVRVNEHNRKHKSFLYTSGGKLDVPREKIIAVGWPRGVREIDPDIDFIDLRVVNNYATGHSPTSGFAAIAHYLSLGDKVTLSGFDLTKASYYETTKLHLPDFEIGIIDHMVARGEIDRY